MGQANQTCPVCERVPGTQHTPECSRSKRSVASLDARAQIAARPRKVYPGKGEMIATFEDAEGERHFLRNRGLPFVNVPKSGKSPFAGGLPPDDKGVKQTPKVLMEEVEFFNAGIASQKARVEAEEATKAKQLSADEEGETHSQELLDEASALGLPASVLVAGRKAAEDKGGPIHLFRNGFSFHFDPRGNVTKTSVEATD